MNTDTPIVLGPFIVADDSLKPTLKGAVVLGVVLLVVWWVSKKF